MTKDIDYSHLDALEFRLHNERKRLENAKSEYEREMRSVWVAGIEKEIACELKFLGIERREEPAKSDDVLLDELFS